GAANPTSKLSFQSEIAFGFITERMNIGSDGTLTATAFSGSGASLTSIPATALTGTLQAAQFPALTGDVTTSSGSLATAIGAGKVTNSMLAGSIDLTSKVTGTLPASNGGTGNGFTAFSGPASSTKTFTLPNVTCTILTTNAAVTAAQGGTGLDSSAWAQGDLVYISATGTWNHLPKNTSSSRYLSNTGTSNNPAWAQVDLGNGVTGTLPVGNGGTGAGTLAAHGVVIGNGTSALNATGTGTANQLLTSNGSSADPTFQDLPTSVNGQSVLAANFSITAANGTAQDTALSVTLPSAGTYELTANVRLTFSFSAGTQGYVTCKLPNTTDSTDVSNSERMLYYSATTNFTVMNTTSMRTVVTVAASKTINLYVTRNSATTWT